jgi:hypothetical protein
MRSRTQPFLRLVSSTLLAFRERDGGGTVNSELTVCHRTCRFAGFPNEPHEACAGTWVLLTRQGQASIGAEEGDNRKPLGAVDRRHEDLSHQGPLPARIERQRAQSALMRLRRCHLDRSRCVCTDDATVRSLLASGSTTTIRS